MNRRFGELDSIRGLAAVTVVLSHSITISGLVAPGTNFASIFNMIIVNSPLKILLLGHEAVILFFILSGFVLSLSYYRNANQTYFSYIIRRFCRIYIPYLCAILCGILMRISFSKDIFPELWNTHIDWGVILNHIFLLGMFNQNAFDPVVWSLVHEMRISIIFPFLILLINKFHWKVNIVFGVICSLLGISLHYLFKNKLDLYTNYYDSMHYILMFTVGALLAKYSLDLIKIYQTKSTWIKFLFFVSGLCFYIYSRAVVMRFLDDSLLITLVSDWGTMIGGAIIIITSIAEKRASKILLIKPISYIGKTSYSIYLYHLIIFLTLKNLLNGMLSNWLIWLLGMLFSLLVSTIMYFIIEEPSISIGKKLTKVKFGNGNKSVA
ncbi:acyltransferase [Bacillus sp. AFS037270]|uniref:acyltransferase family protein n=1 Tax=Bacillus sp. AFS037270 TaxID=2033499 RepID=UPI00159B85DB|nr:acyltransferase [Bacillus sp. AFS037270]